MDFQGQGKADTGEQEALAIIDTTLRFITVLALPDRKVTTFVPAFLDAIVFQHGPPDILHCDEAPEFMSELMAVKTSTTVFIQLAKNHDQFVKTETAATLNEKGFPRTFEVGAMVKARFPPTKAELDITGRRSNHVSAWRGPCRIDDRLFSTTYRLTQLDTNRQYERAIIKMPRNALFDPETSDPFTVKEFIAVRDEPKS
jgi:hypothetical protein